jgi:hypothetical protein
MNGCTGLLCPQQLAAQRLQVAEGAVGVTWALVWLTRMLREAMMDLRVSAQTRQWRSGRPEGPTSESRTCGRSTHRYFVTAVALISVERLIERQAAAVAGAAAGAGAVAGAAQQQQGTVGFNLTGSQHAQCALHRANPAQSRSSCTPACIPSHPPDPAGAATAPPSFCSPPAGPTA